MSRSRRIHLVPPLLGLLTALLAVPTLASTTSAPSGAFELIGHNPLMNRGMNAAPAIFDHFVYIGSRTDGAHPNAGVLIVDVADPENPRVVGQIGRPEEGKISQTSRELRVWPQQQLLMVMNFQCSVIIHTCLSQADVTGSLVRNIKFYDLSGDPRRPRLIATYRTSATPHEMFLWVDPSDPDRALLYLSTPNSETSGPNMIVTDISGARQGTFEEVVRFKASGKFAAAFRDRFDVRLHSMGVSADGTRAYLAFLGGGFMVLDTSDLATGVADPAIRILNNPGQPSWGDPGAHSAVKVPASSYALTTDEVYGDAQDPFTGQDHGCPWGWVRLLDLSDEASPTVAGEYRIRETRPGYCQTLMGRNPLNTFFTSYSSHNPTVLPDLAFVTWHSGGLQAIDLTDPANPRSAGSFFPKPLPIVFAEDPALSLGISKVVMWSYPIIQDGLIYVVDVRNGLYVLRYQGVYADRVAGIEFLEGNSNLGDAGALDV